MDTKIINPKEIVYLTYEECKKHVKKNFKNVKSKTDWTKLNKHLFPDNIPKRPDHVYKNKGWFNWSSFLDTTNIWCPDKSKLFLTFKEAKKFLKDKGFKHRVEYENWIIKNAIKNLPKRPGYVYKGKGWRGYVDYLNYIPNNESYGERKIREILNDNNIYFIPQKMFDSCRNINELPFDFYLPKYNILIEYDGELHYIESSKYGGLKTLKRIQKHDKIKDNWCVKNNYKLIRITYKQKKNIEKILLSII